jgi:hypothetical protein
MLCTTIFCITCRSMKYIARSRSWIWQIYYSICLEWAILVMTVLLNEFHIYNFRTWVYVWVANFIKLMFFPNKIDSVCLYNELDKRWKINKKLRLRLIQRTFYQNFITFSMFAYPEMYIWLDICELTACIETRKKDIFVWFLNWRLLFSIL